MGFQDVFDQLDTMKHGYVTYSQVQSLLETIYFNPIPMYQIQASVHHVCGVGVKSVNSNSFLPVLEEIDRRQSILELALWDFQALDVNGNHKITVKDALFLFQDFHVENCYYEFLNSRMNPLGDVSFDELSLWLCTVPMEDTDQSCLVEERKRIEQKQLEYHMDQYHSLSKYIVEPEKLEVQRYILTPKIYEETVAPITTPVVHAHRGSIFRDASTLGSREVSSLGSREVSALGADFSEENKQAMTRQLVRQQENLKKKIIEEQERQEQMFKRRLEQKRGKLKNEAADLYQLGERQKTILETLQKDERERQLSLMVERKNRVMVERTKTRRSTTTSPDAASFNDLVKDKEGTQNEKMELAAKHLQDKFEKEAEEVSKEQPGASLLNDKSRFEQLKARKLQRKNRIIEEVTEQDDA